VPLFFLSALRKSSSETDSHRNDDASTYLLAPLELSLQKYLQEPVDSAFDVGAVSQLENDNASHPDMHATSVDRTLPNTSSSSDCDLRESENVIMSRPEFMSYGPIFKTCHAVELTEAETEYKVTCTKHIFKEHVVFHFKCSNTIEDQILENVSVVMEIIEGTEAFAEVLTVPLGTMPLGQFGSTFVSYERAQGLYPVAKMSCTLKFTSKEIDPSSGEAESEGYEDEYTLEDIDVILTDFVNGNQLSAFRKVWDALPAEDEKVDEYSLGSRDSLDEALEAVLGILGLHACEGSELIPTSARSHTTLLSGFFVGDHSVLVQLNMGMGSSNSVAMKLVVRADQPHIAEMFHTLVSEA